MTSAFAGAQSASPANSTRYVPERAGCTIQLALPRASAVSSANGLKKLSPARMRLS